MKDGEEGLADGSLGSLNAYFEHYFDSQNPKDLIKEMEKLSKVMKVTLEGLESSEEGKETVYFMVSDEASGGAYGIFQDHLKVILLQCQNNVDWADVTNVLLKNTANVLEFVFCWISSIAKYTKEGTITSTKILRPKLYGKLLSFIPIIFEKGYGIKEIKGEVRITLDKLAEILAKNIDSKGKNDRPIKRTLSALDKGTKLINWANDEWKHKMPRFEEIANKANVPEIVVPKFGGRYTSFSANSTLELLGSRADGAISMASLKANIDVLVQITQNDKFDVELDPITRQLPFNFILNYSNSVAALSAGITDTIGVLNSQLIFQRRLLNSFRLQWALRTYLPKLLAVSSIGVSRLLTSSVEGRLLVFEEIAKGKALSRLVAISNLAVMVTAGVGAIDAYETGDRQALNGHIYTIMGSTFMLAGPFRMLQGIAVSSRQAGWLFFFGMIYLLAADQYKRRAHKSDFEELLYRCFWGNSNKYAFWYFMESGKLSIPQRIELASKKQNDEKIHLALKVETQEFYNYCYMPSLKVEVLEEISKTRKRYKYRFVLPYFKLGESNVVAAVYNKGWVDPRRPAYLQQTQRGTFKVNEEATKAFAQAFAKAETVLDECFPSTEKLSEPDFLGVPCLISVEDLLNHFTIEFEVEMDNQMGYELELHWYYEQRKGITVPKRRLTRNGRLLKTYHGMINSHLADIERNL